MKVHQLKALIKQCIYEVMQEQFSGGAPSPAFESRNMQRRPQEPGWLDFKDKDNLSGLTSRSAVEYPSPSI